MQAVALCQFLENNRQQVNLMDKAVLELGAGTGLLSVVASLLGKSTMIKPLCTLHNVCRSSITTNPLFMACAALKVSSLQPPYSLWVWFSLTCPGAWVTATDLPEILSNLTFNLMRNTKGRSRYSPQVTALTWGRDLERDFPCSLYHYDYVLAADVVYPHECLEELLDTMRYFCRPGSRTTLLWANKVRFHSDRRFTESFKGSFDATLLAELPQQEVTIYKATAKQ